MLIGIFGFFIQWIILRIYKYNDISWIQLGLDIDGEEEYNLSGNSVSLNDDGIHVLITKFFY